MCESGGTIYSVHKTVLYCRPKQTSHPLYFVEQPQESLPRPRSVLKIVRLQEGGKEHVLATCGAQKTFAYLTGLVMSNQRFLEIVCFRFPTNVPKKIEYIRF